MRHPRETSLPLAVDRASAVPMGEQLVRQVRALVASGVLRAGDPLPASRSLAARLGISRGTVTTAWDVLAGEGYLQADRGATRIAPDVMVTSAAATNASTAPSTPPAHLSPPPPQPLSPTSPRRTSRAPGLRSTYDQFRSENLAQSAPQTQRRSARGKLTEMIDLRPGAAAITALDTAAWRGAWRDAASSVARGSEGAGSQELTAHLSDYLRRNRGVLREPDEIVVTAGARDGLQLVLHTLGARVGRKLRVAVENPGYSALRRVVQAAGHVPIPVSVDEYGLDPSALPTGRWSDVSLWDVEQLPDVVLVTPGHQYPLGGTMPVSRRLELLRWARDNGAVVVEDDYDSELRHTGQPLPALAALDTHRDTVITLGSFTKVLGEGGGVGHLVAPDQLLHPISALRADLGSPVSRVAQTALARFMDSGQLQRHTAKIRRTYRDRRTLLAQELDGLRETRVVPMAGGSHAVVEVAQETATLQALAQKGVLVAGLGGYWAASSVGSGLGMGSADAAATIRGGANGSFRGGMDGNAGWGADQGRKGTGRNTGRGADQGRKEADRHGGEEVVQGGLVLGLGADKDRFTRGVALIREVLHANAASKPTEK